MGSKLDGSGLATRALDQQDRDAILNGISPPAHKTVNSPLRNRQFSVALRAYNQLQHLADSLRILHLLSVLKA